MLCVKYILLYYLSSIHQIPYQAHLCSIQLCFWWTVHCVDTFLSPLVIHFLIKFTLTISGKCVIPLMLCTQKSRCHVVSFSLLDLLSWWHLARLDFVHRQIKIDNSRVWKVCVILAMTDTHEMKWNHVWSWNEMKPCVITETSLQRVSTQSVDVAQSVGWYTGTWCNTFSSCK